jgi:hypothetical protein
MTTNENEMLDIFPYEVLSGSPGEILLTYVIVLSSCIVLLPICNFIVGSIAKGLSKWRG